MVNGNCITTGTINADRINMTGGSGSLSNGIYVKSPGWLANAVPSPSGRSRNPIIYLGANTSANMSKPRESVGLEFWDNGEMFCKHIYTESGANSTDYMSFIKTPLQTQSSIDAINYVIGHTSSGSRGINVNTYAEAFDIYAATSDENLKKNIQDTKVTAMDYINQIKFIEFNWKENDEFQQLGFSAQQLKIVCEDFVSSVKQPARSRI